MNKVLYQIRKKKKELKESAWLLGICENGYDDLKKGNIHWISNGVYEGKKWFADPFILDYNDHEISLLVEEFDYKVHRGRIAKLTIDRNSWTVINCKIILDIETHLSFPMIWRQGEEVLVCPENYHSGAWNMYRFDGKNEKLEFVQQIIAEELTDAIIWQNEKDFWLFSTYEPRPNGAELTIWRSKELTGKYEKSQCVKFDENIGRNAGMIFYHDTKIIRPAQESNKVYGHSISFQEISLVDDNFCFSEIFRFVTPHPVYDAGTHTYNEYNGMAVIDAKGYRYRKTAKTIEFLGGILVKLNLKDEYRPH